MLRCRRFDALTRAYAAARAGSSYSGVRIGHRAEAATAVRTRSTSNRLRNATQRHDAALRARHQLRHARIFGQHVGQQQLPGAGRAREARCVVHP